MKNHCLSDGGGGYGNLSSSFFELANIARTLMKMLVANIPATNPIAKITSADI